MSVVVDVIEKSSDSPCILTYQSGNELATKKGVRRSIEINVDEKTLRKNVKVTLDDHTYEGEEKPNGPTRKFIVIRKASNGSVYLIESAEADLVHSSLKKKPAVVAEGTDYVERVSALLKTFGGKRGQRRMERSVKYRKNNSINEESLMMAVNDASFDTSVTVHSQLNTSQQKQRTTPKKGKKPALQDG